MARNGNRQWLRRCCELLGQLLMQPLIWLWAMCKRSTVNSTDNADDSCVVAVQCQDIINQLERTAERPSLGYTSWKVEHPLLSGTRDSSNEGVSAVGMSEIIYSYPQQEQPLGMLENGMEVVVHLTDQAESCMQYNSTVHASACSGDAAAAAALEEKNSAPENKSIQPIFPMPKGESTATGSTVRLAPTHDASSSSTLDNHCILHVASPFLRPDQKLQAAAEARPLRHVLSNTMVSFSVRDEIKFATGARVGRSHGTGRLLACSSDRQLGASTSGVPAVRWPPPRLLQLAPVFEPPSLQPYDGWLPSDSPEDGRMP